MDHRMGGGHTTAIYIYIYKFLCSIRFFFSPMGSRMRRCFRAHGTNESDQKKRFFPRWKVSNFQHKCTEMSTLVRTSNAFKNGALMSRNISTPLLDAYTRAILERFTYPCFHAQPQNPWNLFFAAFRDDFVGVLGPPPNRAPEYFQVTRR